MPIITTLVSLSLRERIDLVNNLVGCQIGSKNLVCRSYRTCNSSYSPPARRHKARPCLRRVYRQLPRNAPRLPGTSISPYRLQSAWHLPALRHLPHRFLSAIPDASTKRLLISSIEVTFLSYSQEAICLAEKPGIPRFFTTFCNSESVKPNRGRFCISFFIKNKTLSRMQR